LVAEKMPGSISTAMSGPQFEVGEGEVSLGQMVVICEAADRESAAAAAAHLESAGIPALVQSDVGGLPNIPSAVLVGDGFWVAVPSLMTKDAARALATINVPVVGRRGGALPADLPRDPTEPIGALSEDAEALAPAPLPDSGPVMPRVALALAAIAFGALGQQILEALLGREVALSTLGATSAHADQWWRLVTAGFAHFSFAHHFSNAVFGLTLGVVLFGTHRVGAVMAAWLVSSMVGVTAEMALSTAGALIAGASAGNYGLVGLWVRGQMQRAGHSVLPRRERLRTLGVIVLLAPGALTPVTASGSRVAVIAHAAGFIAGLLIGGTFERRLRADSLGKIDVWAKLGGVLAAAVVIIAFAFAAPHLIPR